MSRNRFSHHLLHWFADNGRKNLPWQIDKTPYRVWVSEIMLQQTQVKTVIPYFNRFMQRFPGVATLADTPLEEVMEYWAGLGYYGRAKHLHRAATCICEEHNGELPSDFEALSALPGIGRSTAGAILALCYEKPFAILDGNVKRVIARQYGIDGWPGKSAVAKELWRLSESLLPKKRVADYTQALMDLGAMICLRSKPRCEICAVRQSCEARQKGTVAQCPGKAPATVKPSRKTVMLIISCGDSVMFERRPDTGIWSSLLSFPEIDEVGDSEAWCMRRLGTAATASRCVSKWPEIRHTFTHFKLTITPLHIRLQNFPKFIMENNLLIWYKIRERQAVPTPVKYLLQRLESKLKQETV